MADSKRLKSTRNGGKKRNAVKQALKKKQLSCKSKNDDLREVLDRQAQSLYPVRPGRAHLYFLIGMLNILRRCMVP
jgi:hypothetical protein